MKHSKMKPAPYRFDRDDEFHTPPPFVRCDECDGTSWTHYPSLQYHAELCHLCAHSPMPGWLPQYYTADQYRDWIRRENGLPDYELPDDMPVWVYEHFKYYGNLWTERLMIDLRTIEEKEGDMPDNPVVIATDAGRPPKDWGTE